MYAPSSATPGRKRADGRPVPFAFQFTICGRFDESMAPLKILISGLLEFVAPPIISRELAALTGPYPNWVVTAATLVAMGVLSAPVEESILPASNSLTAVPASV